MGTNTRETYKIVLYMIYQEEITNYINIIIYSKYNPRK